MYHKQCSIWPTHSTLCMARQIRRKWSLFDHKVPKCLHVIWKLKLSRIIVCLVGPEPYDTTHSGTSSKNHHDENEVAYINMVSKIGALPKLSANLSSEPEINSCDNLAKIPRSGKGLERECICRKMNVVQFLGNAGMDSVSAKVFGHNQWFRYWFRVRSSIR